MKEINYYVRSMYLGLNEVMVIVGGMMQAHMMQKRRREVQMVRLGTKLSTTMLQIWV